MTQTGRKRIMKITQSRLLENLYNALGKVIYTNKTHEKEIELLTNTIKLLQIFEIVLISLTAGGTITIIFGLGIKLQIITAILATLATMITIYQMSFNPEQLIVDHRRSARKLWFIREKYVNLIDDYCDKVITEKECIKKRDELLEEVYEIYRETPVTSEKAFKLARKSLNIADEKDISNEELIKLLPKSIKKDEEL